MSRVFPALVSLSFLAACGGGGGDDAFDAPPAAVDAIDAAPLVLAPPPDGEGFQVRVADTLAPGEIATFCQFFPLPDGGLQIGKIEHRASADSMVHVVVHPTASPPEALPPVLIRNCGEDVLGEARLGTPLYARHTPDGDLTLPDGVAIPLPPERGESIYVELLVENRGSSAVTSELLLNVWFATGTITAEAGTFYAQSTLIAVAPGAAGTSHTRCPLPAGVHLIDAQPHTNRSGTAATASIDTAGTLTPFLTADETMALTTLTPEVVTTAGQVLDFSCQYQNAGTTTLVEGADPRSQERCSVTTTYYVPGGTRLPLTDEGCISDDNIVWEGDQTCMQAVTCQQAIDWNGAPYDQAFGEYSLCRIEACDAGAGGPYTTMLDCAFLECGDVCAAVTPGSPHLEETACRTCVEGACGADLAACEASTCP